MTSQKSTLCEEFFRQKTLVIDTNLLIDLFATNNQRILLELKRLYEMTYIPDIILSELTKKSARESEDSHSERKQKTERFFDDQNHIGLIRPISTDDVWERALLLSCENHLIHFADACVYYLCADNGFICVSNDRNLKEYCERNQTDNRWGLEMVFELCRASILTKKDAVKIMRELSSVNAMYQEEIIAEYVGYVECI